MAYGPNIEALSYKGYLINGLRFHTKDGERGTQNSGVSLSANTVCRASARDTRQVEIPVTYYGVIRQIILLDFCEFQYPVFNCDWANIGTGIKVEEGFTLVNLHHGISNNHDTFVLASQVQPVFYSRDSSESDWYVVLRSPPRGFHNVDDYVDNELGNVSTPPPCISSDYIGDLECFDENEDYERKDSEGTWIVKNKKRKGVIQNKRQCRVKSTSCGIQLRTRLLRRDNM